MNPHHLSALALVVLVVAGCSNHAEQLTGPSALASRLAPGLPPIEQSSPPRIRVWTDDGWRESQKEGAYSLEPSNIFDLEVSDQQAVSFHWSAQPAGQLIGIRWCVDSQDIFDNTPRTGPEDIAHWSSLSDSETSATVGPFSAGLHWVYIEARSKVGLISLFPIRVQVVSAAEPGISQAQ